MFVENTEGDLVSLTSPTRPSSPGLLTLLDPQEVRNGCGS